MRLRSNRPVLLAATVLALSACATQAPEPVATVAPIVLEPPQPKPRRMARLKRPEVACLATKVDLPQDRKEALFREFDLTAGAGAGATVAPTAVPGPAHDCRQASR